MSKSSIGQVVAEQIYDEIKAKMENTSIKKTVKPYLAVVHVGDDQASEVYIKFKKRACEKLGFGFKCFKYPSTIKTEKLVKHIMNINIDPTITGCIVQLPLPDHIDTYKILDCVDPQKDVDCFHTQNTGKLYLGLKHAQFIPATAYGIYYLLKSQNIKTKGKCIVIIGKSNIVGKPLQILLSDEETLAGTTIFCDKYTENVKRYTQMADILVVAAGKHHLIKDPDFIKDGCVVIDVGIHRVKVKVDGKFKFRLQGDVDYEALKDKCLLITPVPGGVGPLTVASLMHNVAKPFF